ncbi:hypothetical protein [Thermus caldifontis]|uniref:hypothetical protein n=1 Tax=Thermus caldifontis TaxID=1930763 RepID=UPI000DF4C8CC|nr:hypothetical protein [Thermus caldifontis]
MSVFDRIRQGVGNALGRGLDVFRGDVPRVEPPKAITLPPPPPPAAVQVGGWGFAWIDNEDFEATGLAYRPNEYFPVAQMRTPETAHFRILAQERRLRIYIKGLAKRPGQNYSTPTNRTVVIAGLVETPQAKPSLPSLYHPEVAVWAKVSGVWQQCPIVSINYATGQITFQEPAGVTGSEDIEVYFVHGDGQFRLRVARDGGGVDDSVATVFNQSFATMHAIDQNNLETMIAWPQQVELVPGTRLVLEVFTQNTPIVWNERAGHYIQIAALGRRIEVLDKGRLQRLAELEARGGL